ncbi:hypothetical protein [Streptomyces zaomyceticus]|uniref:hypothetical protein n=1 Tax=Streptomyces zaomyceticus TaxID=68286 RepID=UPI00367B510F
MAVDGPTYPRAGHPERTTEEVGTGGGQTRDRLGDEARGERVRPGVGLGIGGGTGIGAATHEHAGA